jgi:hypothetical protein
LLSKRRSAFHDCNEHSVFVQGSPRMAHHIQS